MYIRKNSYSGEVCQYGTTCFEHLSPATFTLEINGVLIPICQTCLDELNEKVKRHSSENNDGENNTLAINFEELREDMKEALKIINSDIGMKNSILAQCDTENPETKDTVDAMRRSIADGESMLTKYADGRLEHIERPDGVGNESALHLLQSGNEMPMEANNMNAIRSALGKPFSLEREQFDELQKIVTELQYMAIVIEQGKAMPFGADIVRKYAVRLKGIVDGAR